MRNTYRTTMTTDEVAAMAKVNRNVVSYQIRNGKLQAYKIRRRWVVEQDDAFHWVHRRNQAIVDRIIKSWDSPDERRAFGLSYPYEGLFQKRNL